MELIHEILTNITHQHYIQYDFDKATFKIIYTRFKSVTFAASKFVDDSMDLMI